jgi:hypothetical protein
MRVRLKPHGLAVASEVAARTALVLAVILIPRYLVGPIAARLGCHPDVVQDVFWGLVLALVLLRIRRDPPRRGLTYLDRWLLVVTGLAGLGLPGCYTDPARHDQWALSGPVLLGVLLMVGFVCLLRWVDRNYPGGLAEICHQALGGDPAGPRRRRSVRMISDSTERLLEVANKSQLATLDAF